MRIEEMLRTYRVVAVVGLSREPAKDSNVVASYLKQKGYRIVPINPSVDSVLCERCYKSLSDVPDTEGDRDRRHLQAIRRRTGHRRTGD